MAYTSWSVVFGEQPSAAKWNILGTNDASFNDGTGIDDSVVNFRQLAVGVPVQMASVGYSAVNTGTTTIPLDDTIPQNTEGTEFMSLSITPKSATNILVIESKAYLSSSGTSDLIGALFQDTTANALAVGIEYENVATARHIVCVTHRMVAGTTSATTFKFRSGSSLAATITFNGASAARQFGATTKSSMLITEYKAS